MKLLILFLAFSFSSSAFAADNCSKKVFAHASVKAECFINALIEERSNPEINALVDRYLAEGLWYSHESGQTFAGQFCTETECTGRYIVSTDFKTYTMVKSIVILVEVVSFKEPKLIRVFKESELK